MRPEPARAIRIVTRGPRPARGFTLIEILLALFLLGLLVSVFLFNFMNLLGSRQLEESAMKFEGLLRIARADAANTGKRIRLVTNAEDGACRVEFEADPLGKPGEYIEYKAGSWTAYMPNDTIRIVRVGPPEGPDGAPPAPASPAPAGGGVAITFEPDGTTESVVIELAPVRDDDGRRAIIEIDGVTGTVNRRMMSAMESQGAS